MIADLSHLFNNYHQLSLQQKDSLNEYLTTINLLSKDRLYLEFNNKDSFHAAAVMDSIFRNSSKSVKIFTGNLDQAVCDHQIYLTGLKSYVERGLPLDVIFESTPEPTSKCYMALRKFKESEPAIRLYKLKEGYINNLRQKRSIELHHFAVADDQIFRYETDKSEFKAFCNFDDKEKSATLANNFAILRLNSIEF